MDPQSVFPRTLTKNIKWFPRRGGVTKPLSHTEDMINCLHGTENELRIGLELALALQKKTRSYIKKTRRIANLPYLSKLSNTVKSCGTYD